MILVQAARALRDNEMAAVLIEIGLETDRQIGSEGSSRMPCEDASQGSLSERTLLAGAGWPF